MDFATHTVHLAETKAVVSPRSGRRASRSLAGRSRPGRVQRQSSHSRGGVLSQEIAHRHSGRFDSKSASGTGPGFSEPADEAGGRRISAWRRAAGWTADFFPPQARAAVAGKTALLGFRPAHHCAWALPGERCQALCRESIPLAHAESKLMPKKVLLFAPCAFNLAETSRMVEIAKGVTRHPAASQVFDIHFISDGGEFENLIEKHGFPLTRLEPRLTAEKIEHIAKVDRGEKFAPAFTDAEMIQRVENEVACLKNLRPDAAVTGSYMTIPITCRVLQIPL